MSLFIRASCAACYVFLLADRDWIVGLCGVVWCGAWRLKLHTCCCLSTKYGGFTLYSNSLDILHTECIITVLYVLFLYGVLYLTISTTPPHHTTVHHNNERSKATNNTPKRKTRKNAIPIPIPIPKQTKRTPQHPHHRPKHPPPPPSPDHPNPNSPNRKENLPNQRSLRLHPGPLEEEAQHEGYFCCRRHHHCHRDYKQRQRFHQKEHPTTTTTTTAATTTTNPGIRSLRPPKKRRPAAQTLRRGVLPPTGDWASVDGLHPAPVGKGGVSVCAALGR